MDNVIECEGAPRSLLRKDAGRDAIIRNNRLVNVADATQYEKPTTEAKAGLEEPLKFECGVGGEMIVDGWTVSAGKD